MDRHGIPQVRFHTNAEYDHAFAIRDEMYGQMEEILKASGKKVCAVRHPMPYGDLVAQRVQRFATLDDLDRYNCTIEEREEYEPQGKGTFQLFARNTRISLLDLAEQALFGGEQRSAAVHVNAAAFEHQMPRLAADFNRRLPV